MENQEFKFRDKVWKMHNNKPTELSICRVEHIQADDDRGTPSSFTYLYCRTDYYQKPFTVCPSEIFKTKQELLDSL